MINHVGQSRKSHKELIRINRTENFRADIFAFHSPLMLALCGR